MVDVTDDYTVTQVTGTAKDLIASHQAGNKGKILNALDFPMIDGSPADSRLCTDGYGARVALRRWLPRRVRQDHMRWGLAATSGAHHVWHLDSEGYGTRVQPICGIKFWFVAAEKRGEKGKLASAHLYDDIDVGATNNDKWDVEMVVLSAGSEL